jgi:hypothetical protein
MMGSRGTRGVGEIDCLSHSYRRLVRGRLKAIWYFKRKYWKRHRREARRRARNEARLLE